MKNNKNTNNSIVLQSIQVLFKILQYNLDNSLKQTIETKIEELVKQL